MFHVKLFKFVRGKEEGEEKGREDENGKEWGRRAIEKGGGMQGRVEGRGIREHNIM